MIIRQAKREAFCRCCDKEIQIGEYMFHVYSLRNRGQNIYICLDCIEKMWEMYQNHNWEILNESRN